MPGRFTNRGAVHGGAIDEPGAIREPPLDGFGLSLGGDDADESSAGTVILEPDAPVDLRKQRVVLAETHVETSAELASALPHEDGAAGHDVAVEPLHAEPL